MLLVKEIEFLGEIEKVIGYQIGRILFCRFIDDIGKLMECGQQLSFFLLQWFVTKLATIVANLVFGFFEDALGADIGIEKIGSGVSFKRD